MELLQRRKLCREFLNGYNEKLHPQIISKVFEIGLLILKKNFNKILFSKEELDEIIKVLNGKEYVDILPLPPLKKIKKLSVPHQISSSPQNLQYNFLNIDNIDKNNQNYLKRNFLRNKQYKTRKEFYYDQSGTSKNS